MKNIASFEEERIAAGERIDPKTANFTWGWAQILNPYGVLDNVPEEADCIGRVYFLRAPGSDIWVNSYDLPEETCSEMWRLLELGFYKEGDDWLTSI